jgi:hypothetical protein
MSRHLNDGLAAMTATATELPEFPNLPSALLEDQQNNLGHALAGLWALLHHAGVHTTWHHDGDGGVTVIYCKIGCKIWDLVFWHPNVTQAEVESETMRVCKMGTCHPSAQYAKIVTVCLMPGDVLFVCLSCFIS